MALQTPKGAGEPPKGLLDDLFGPVPQPRPSQIKQGPKPEAAPPKPDAKFPWESDEG